MNNENGFSIDALLPPEMALKAEQIGVKKAQIGFHTMFALAVLAGAFISLGAILFTTITTGAADHIPYGLTRLIGGMGFTLGLILVVIGGAELFTGNNLIVMAWASGKVSTAQLLRNWGIVYVGNFAGSLGTAALMFLTQQYTFAGGAVGANALAIASAKSSLNPLQAVFLGIMCNALVCLAVWMTFSARSTTDKILSMLFPITAFVAAGFEHSIANMYFVPIGLFIKQFAGISFWTSIGKTAADYPSLTWGNFMINNLLPVTLGNIIGGAMLVGAVYWFVYLRKKRSPASPMVSAMQDGSD
jgi:formate transporter